MWPWIIAVGTLLLANAVVAWFEIREASRIIDRATPENLRHLYMVVDPRDAESRPTPKGEAAKRSS